MRDRHVCAKDLALALTLAPAVALSASVTAHIYLELLVASRQLLTPQTASRHGKHSKTLQPSKSCHQLILLHALYLLLERRNSLNLKQPSFRQFRDLDEHQSAFIFSLLVRKHTSTQLLAGL